MAVRFLSTRGSSACSSHGSRFCHCISTWENEKEWQNRAALAFLRSQCDSRAFPSSGICAIRCKHFKRVFRSVPPNNNAHSLCACRCLARSLSTEFACESCQHSEHLPEHRLGRDTNAEDVQTACAFAKFVQCFRAIPWSTASPTTVTAWRRGYPWRVTLYVRAERIPLAPTD
jgi:hypothetical protein